MVEVFGPTPEVPSSTSKVLGQVPMIAGNRFVKWFETNLQSPTIRKMIEPFHRKRVNQFQRYSNFAKRRGPNPIKLHFSIIRVGPKEQPHSISSEVNRSRQTRKATAVPTRMLLKIGSQNFCQVYHKLNSAVHLHSRPLTLFSATWSFIRRISKRQKSGRVFQKSKRGWRVRDSTTWAVR